MCPQLVVPAEVMGQAFKELQQEKGWKREEIVFSTKVGSGAKLTLHTIGVNVCSKPHCASALASNHAGSMPRTAVEPTRATTNNAVFGQ